MWPDQDIELLLDGVIDGEGYVTMSNFRFGRRYTPLQCRAKVRELETKRFTKQEEREMIKHSTLINVFKKTASRKFRRPIYCLKEHLDLLESRGTKTLDRDSRMETKKDRLDGSLQENWAHLEKILAESKPTILEGSCGSCIDLLLKRVKECEIIYFSKQSTYKLLDKIFRHASVSVKNVIVYFDKEALTSHGVVLSTYMKRFPTVHVVGSTDDIRKVGSALLKLFTSSLKLQTPPAPTRLIMLQHVFNHNNVNREVDIKFWTTLTWGYCHHALEALGQEAAALRLTEEEEVKHHHLVSAFRTRDAAKEWGA